ncbi:MAG: carboxypeptidase regulatory-like domain-containing protein [Planctomycetes bacterium]|nr:carboxypeptidase regulatory-like domain-containing protein [Planctomycetota bacterium]
MNVKHQILMLGFMAVMVAAVVVSAVFPDLGSEIESILGLADKNAGAAEDEETIDESAEASEELVYDEVTGNSYSREDYEELRRRREAEASAGATAAENATLEVTGNDGSEGGPVIVAGGAVIAGSGEISTVVESSDDGSNSANGSSGEKLPPYHPEYSWQLSGHRGLDNWQEAQEADPKPAGVIRGEVTDQDGKPLELAKVSVHDRRFFDGRNRYLTVFETVTDAGGNFIFDAVPAGFYDLYVVAEGYASKTLVEFAVIENSQQELKFRLVQELKITGKVTDEEGTPIVGARIEVGTIQEKVFPLVLTDEDGNFSIQHLSNSQYAMRITAEGYGSDTREGIRGGTENLDLKLRPAGGISGNVYFMSEEEPVTAYRVRVFRTNGNAYDRGMDVAGASVYEIFDEKGAFEVDGLRAGRYQIEVFHADYGSKRSEDITIASGEKKPGVVLMLDPGGVLSGVILRSDTKEPVSRAQVAVAECVRFGDSLYPFETSRELTTETDDTGAFELRGMPAGFMKVSVIHETHSKKYFEVTMNPGELMQVMWEISPRGGTVHGGVFTNLGTPLREVRVQLYTESVIAYGRVTNTDENGLYAIENIPPGDYEVSITYPQGMTDRADGAQSLRVDIKDGEVIEVLFGSPDPPNLEGLVFDGNAAAQGLELGLYRANDPSQIRIATAKTDEVGGFIFVNVAVGDYVIISNENGKMVRQQVTLTEETPVIRDLRLYIQYTGIRAKIVDKDAGTPITGGVFILEAAGLAEQSATFTELLARYRGHADISGEGVIELRGIDPGNYRVRIEPSGHAFTILENIVVSEGQVNDLGTYAIERDRRLAGKIESWDEKPVGSAQLIARDQYGRYLTLVGQTQSNPEGNYQLRGLSEGLYEVTVKASGFAMFTTNVMITAAAGERQTLDISLYPASQVSVVVKNEAGDPVTAAAVTVLDSSGNPLPELVPYEQIFIRGNVTDGNGILELTSLAPGNYLVRVVAQNYDPLTKELTVSSEGKQVLEFKFEPPAEEEPEGEGG